MSTIWPNPIRALRQRSRDARVIKRWRDTKGAGPPPSALKQQVVRDYGNRFSLSTLVETGTFQGDMIFAMKDCFHELHSIELGQDLYEKAWQRFAAYSHIHLHQGDSAKVLPKLLPALKSPAVFWLDGHYSQGITARADKDTPIVEELAAIYRHNPTGHVILIDDARLFTGVADYPSMETLREMLDQWSPGTKLELADDIIRLHHTK